MRRCAAVNPEAAPGRAKQRQMVNGYAPKDRGTRAVPGVERPSAEQNCGGKTQGAAPRLGLASAMNAQGVVDAEPRFVTKTLISSLTIGRG